jgi:hypothetical protein
VNLTRRVCVGPLGSDDETAAVSLVAAALLEAVRLRPSAGVASAFS